MTLYWISQFLQTCLFPPGINILLGFIGVIFWQRILGKSLIIIALASLWLLSTPIFSAILIDRLQNQYPVLRLNKLNLCNNTHEAIVILGGVHDKSPVYPNNYVVSEATLSRLQYAAYLYQRMPLPIIVSGGGADYTEAALMIEILKEQFKTPVQLKEDKSINTADEAKFLAPLLKKHKINTIYLVTHAWHMPRSVYAFKNRGIHVIPAPMGYIIQDSYSWLPSLRALNTTALALHEYIGMVWYWIYY